MFLSLGSFGLRRYKPYGCREQQPYRKKLRPYRLRELSASRGGAAMENDHLDSWYGKLVLDTQLLPLDFW